MMRKKWIGLLLVILIILVSLPAVFGWVAKKSLNHLVAELPMPEGATLSLQDHIFGWLNSYVAIKIHMPKAKADHPYVAADAIDIIIHGNITHGPLFTTEKGLQLGIARLDTHTTLQDVQGLKEDITQQLALLFKDNDLLRAQSVFYLTRDIAIDLKSSPIQAQQQGDTLQWNGFNAQIKINKDFDQVNMSSIINPALFATAKGALLDTAQIQFDAKLYREAQQPWVGEQMFKVPTFYLRDETGSVLRFDHLKVVSMSHMLKGLLQASLDIEATNIEFNKKHIDELSFDLEISDFASKPLLSMGQLMQTAQQLSAQDKQALVELVTQALVPGADIEFDYRLAMKNQQVIAHVLLNFPEVQQQPTQTTTANVQALLKDLNAQVEFSAPQAVIKDMLLDMAVSTWAQQIGAQALTPEQIDRLKATIDAQLNQLIQMGILVANNDNYQLNLDYNQGNFDLNDKVLTQQEMFVLLMLLTQAVPNESTGD